MSSPAKKQKYSGTRKNFHNNQKKGYFLECGQRGFLATCNFREKDCIRESYNLLNQYANELYGPEPEDLPVDTENEIKADVGLDIVDDLQKQIDATKAQQQKGRVKGVVVQKRFQSVTTGANNCLFIRTTLKDPVELGYKIVCDIAETKEQKCRFLLRLVPIEVVCRANMDYITTAGGLLFDKHFLKTPSSYSIVFNRRYNNDIKRDDLIRELAVLVQSKNVNNRVDLKQPEKTVVVEIIKGFCCLAVLEDYQKYKKYNLVELATSKDEHVEANDNGSMTTQVTDKIGEDTDLDQSDAANTSAND